LKIKKNQCLNDNNDTNDLDYVIAQYKSKDQEVKRRYKEEKNKWLEDKAQEAGSAAYNGDVKTLYRIVKDLSGRSQTQTVSVKTWTDLLTVLMKNSKDDGE